jgi:hypothetical protein
MAMGSIAEIGVDRLGVGFELVAELVERFGIGFAMDFGEFRKLKVSFAVVDTSGGRYGGVF